MSSTESEMGLNAVFSQSSMNSKTRPTTVPMGTGWDSKLSSRRRLLRLRYSWDIMRPDPSEVWHMKLRVFSYHGSGRGGSYTGFWARTVSTASVSPATSLPMSLLPAQSFPAPCSSRSTSITASEPRDDDGNDGRSTLSCRRLQMTALGNQLTSVALYEREQSGFSMRTWAYPSLDDDADALISKRIPWGPDSKSRSRQGSGSFIFSRHATLWHYIATFPSGPETPNITAFAIVINSSRFNPERFAALLKVMGEVYASTGTPVRLLEVFLAVFTTGRSGSFDSSAYTDAQALLGPVSVKRLISRFGVESVVLWNAMVQKKRVLVLGSSLADLLQAVRAFPQFVWHRQNWGLLRPYLTPSEEELAELTSCGVYVAGVLDPRLTSRTDLYDVVVNLTTDTITVTDQAKDDLRMGSLHKDVSSLMVAAAETRTDQEVIKALALKTLEVVKQLRATFAPPTGGPTTAADLIERVQASDLPSTMHRFVINVGLAEGFTKQ